MCLRLKKVIAAAQHMDRQTFSKYERMQHGIDSTAAWQAPASGSPCQISAGPFPEADVGTGCCIMIISFITGGATLDSQAADQLNMQPDR